MVNSSQKHTKTFIRHSNQWFEQGHQFSRHSIMVASILAQNAGFPDPPPFLFPPGSLLHSFLLASSGASSRFLIISPLPMVKTNARIHPRAPGSIRKLSGLLQGPLLACLEALGQATLSSICAPVGAGPAPVFT